MRQNDSEHKAFEEMGKEMGLDLEMHPLHLLYLVHLDIQYPLIESSNVRI